MRQGARRLDATDGQWRSTLGSPKRATVTTDHIETRGTAIRRKTSGHTTASLCRPTRYSASGIRRATARLLPASTLLLSIPQLWWSYLRTMLVGLAARLLATVVTSASPTARALDCGAPPTKPLQHGSSFDRHASETVRCRPRTGYLTSLPGHPPSGAPALRPNRGEAHALRPVLLSP